MVEAARAARDGGSAALHRVGLRLRRWSQRGTAQ
jgi:hypothetical protein